MKKNRDYIKEIDKSLEDLSELAWKTQRICIASVFDNEIASVGDEYLCRLLYKRIPVEILEPIKKLSELTKKKNKALV